MKTFKKILCLMLVLVMAFAIAGCGGKKDEKQPTNEPPKNENKETSNEVAGEMEEADDVMSLEHYLTNGGKEYIESRMRASIEGAKCYVEKDEREDELIIYLGLKEKTHYKKKNEVESVFLENKEAIKNDLKELCKVMGKDGKEYDVNLKKIDLIVVEDAAFNQDEEINKVALAEKVLATLNLDMTKKDEDPQEPSNLPNPQPTEETQPPMEPENGEDSEEEPEDSGDANNNKPKPGNSGDANNNKPKPENSGDNSNNSSKPGNSSDTRGGNEETQR